MSLRGSSSSGAVGARVLLGLAVAVIAAATWVVSETQRSAAQQVFEEGRAGNRMLTAMLDQETGLRGFALSGDEEFLQPYVRGAAQFDRAVADLRSLVRDENQRATIYSMVLAARRWQRLAEGAISQVRRGERLGQASIARRKEVFDDFRTIGDAFDAELTVERDRELRQAGVVSAAVIVGLALAFAAFGYLVIERQMRRTRRRRERERDYRRTQGEFAAAMQVMRSEPEAHGLVKHHLEGMIAGAEAVVLNRNNSDSRLVAATAIPDDHALAERLDDAEPESCLAVRLGRVYEQGEAADPLLRCELCGAAAPEVLCTPSLVGGEVIGSVLVRRARPFDPVERTRIADSVAQAAPVLANLRNLAIAESRAATDALTGLANARSCRDTLKQMAAQAGRAVSPLTVALLDLDHFKQVNDRFGHGVGDDVLAAVGEALRSSLRASDFAGRYGGEEFLLLLPDTGKEGGLEVAERARDAVEALAFERADLTVTASVGVATYPFDAVATDDLLRLADRALYVAKANGRNRVEPSVTTPDSQLHA